MGTCVLAFAPMSVLGLAGAKIAPEKHDQARKLEESEPLSPSSQNAPVPMAAIDIDLDFEREPFNLVNKHPPATEPPAPLSHRHLPTKALIVFLYILQGVPMGLIFGSIPYMLKATKRSSLSYGHFGLFSLAGYPYSLKLFWSPIVDHFYVQRWGRRKSWLLPVQIGIGVAFWVLSTWINDWIQPGKPVDFWKLNGSFLFLVTLCATMDIAIDGWVLTLLPPAKRHMASTCQSVGLNIGLSISFTIFLALSSEQFCQQFLGMNGDVGLISLGGFMKFWAVIYAASAGLLLFKTESTKAKPNAGTSGQSINNTAKIFRVYNELWKILQLPTVRVFSVILLTFKFAFSAYDAVAPLKLLEKGFPKESLAVARLIDFPFQIVAGYIVSRWSNSKDAQHKSKTLEPWIFATYARVIMSFIGLYVINRFEEPNTVGKTTLIIATTIVTSFCHTAMFVSMGSYFLSISDPLHGGTYLTLMNTLSIFAGMWPKLPVMLAVEVLTFKRCPCYWQVSQKYCQDAGGRCNITFDGFYPVSTACMLVGLAWFQWWIKPNIEALQEKPLNAWMVASPTAISGPKVKEPFNLDEDASENLFLNQSNESLRVFK